MTRNIVSLLLVIHIFCVAVALWANVNRSAIESRLLSVLSPYLRPLHLDPDGVRFHLVHDAEGDDDRFFEVVIEGNDDGQDDGEPKVVVLPDGGARTGLARRRYFALSHVMGFYANPDTENETTTAEIAKSIGGAVLREAGAERAIVRCRHQLSQPRDLEDLEPRFPKDPLAKEYGSIVYEADVWIDDSGLVQVNPRISALETAGVETKSEGAADKPADSPAVESATPKDAAGAKPPVFDPRSERYPFRPQPGRPESGRASDDDGKTP